MLLHDRAGLLLRVNFSFALGRVPLGMRALGEDGVHAAAQACGVCGVCETRTMRDVDRPTILVRWRESGTVAGGQARPDN